MTGSTSRSSWAPGPKPPSRPEVDDDLDRDRVGVFWALLFLCHQGKVDLEQPGGLGACLSLRRCAAEALGGHRRPSFRPPGRLPRRLRSSWWPDPARKVGPPTSVSTRQMKAMILAAGKGTRVRPITHTIPKPMIPILQKPVMEFLLELLRQHGFTEVMVNVSHLAEEIENYFRDGQRFGVEIAYSFEGRIEDGELIGDALGSAGGLKKIQNFQRFFDDTFVVLCGDALIDLDLTEAVRRHREKGAMASLITKRVPNDQVSSYGVVVTDADGRVLSFQEKPPVAEAASNMINTGIYIFEPEVLDFVPSDQPFDIGSDLFPKLVAAGAPFYALPMEFEWVDIGKVPDYWQAIRSVLQGQVRQVQIPGKEVRPGVFTGLNVAADWDRSRWRGPIYVGGMTRIEDGATIIGPAMIGPSCQICEGATIDNSIIFDYSRIGPGVRLVEKLVFGRYCVDRNGDHFDLQEAALDWLITDARRQDVVSPSPQQKAMAELLGSDLNLNQDLVQPQRARDRAGLAGPPGCRGGQACLGQDQRDERSSALIAIT